MNNMIVTINNQDYVVTDMIEIGKGMDKVYKYNVFTLDYKHIVTIVAENFEDFTNKLTKYLNNEMV